MTMKATLFNKINRLPEFERDLKKLSKKFRTLEEDLSSFIKIQLAAFHKLDIDNQGISRIANLGIDSPLIYKARKFACKALKGRGAMSGIRVIYAYDEEADEVTLIEIYYKGEKANEDRERIFQHYG